MTSKPPPRPLPRPVAVARPRPRPPRSLRVGEVADIFGVSVQTVRDWTDAGHLPYFRTPGGQRRYHRADIEAWLEADQAAEG